MANSGTLFLSCLVVKLISCYRIISPFPGSNTQVLYKYCIRCISAEISFIVSISSASGGPRGGSAEVVMTRRCVLPFKLSCWCKCPLPAAPTLGSPGAGQSCPGAGSARAGAELRACQLLQLHTNTMHMWPPSAFALCSSFSIFSKIPRPHLQITFLAKAKTNPDKEVLLPFLQRALGKRSWEKNQLLAGGKRNAASR